MVLTGYFGGHWDAVIVAPMASVVSYAALVLFVVLVLAYALPDSVRLFLAWWNGPRGDE